MRKQIYLVFIFSLLISAGWGQVERVLVLNPLLKPFYHGVASGDPLSNSVIIWTRLTPDTGFVGPANVEWRIALDTGMTTIVQSGNFTTDINRDYTVKVDVTGLQPDTWYYYEFTHNTKNSIRGRTKTAPVGMKDSLRFAVVSCADYQNGYFNAYKILKTRNDIDAVIHLGDYMYEYGEDGGAVGGRMHVPSDEITELIDYRTRLSQYHLDDDLMRLHQQFPFIMVWDDHESANNSWKDGAENHDAGEGNWVDRKNYSKIAYYEWLPVRPQIISGDSVLFRKIPFGQLIDLVMVDTRLHGRDEQAGTTGGTVNSPSRTLLGTDQYNWLIQNMVTSTADWKILGNQVMFAPLQIAGIGINEDQWDGYPYERSSIISQVLANNVEGVVVLTGDIHTAWANDVPTANYESDGTGSAFVEFVTTSVTSSNSPVGGLGESVIQLANNHMKYINLADHGFLILDVNQNRAQSDFFYVNTLTTPSGAYHWEESWYVIHNERHLRNTNTAAFPRAELNHLQAPPWPRVVINSSNVENNNANILMGVYPNPFMTGVYFQYHLASTSTVEILITDLNGRLIANTNAQQMPAGIHSSFLELTVTPGVYLATLRVNNKDCFVSRIIKQ
jgi:alkaline phosphatase D